MAVLYGNGSSNPVEDYRNHPDKEKGDWKIRNRHAHPDSSDHLWFTVTS
tara:strand:+ start:6240 stop:6386 length:147 start_codon:yes stop_codon:yes gene_type:complete